MNTKTTLFIIKFIKNILVSFLIIFPAFTIAQNNINLNEFKNIFAEKSHQHNWTNHLKESTNEVNFIFSLLFIVYKEIFSSQDVDSCVFTPSCSVYAIESIKQNGVFIGGIDAFDRISRCNPGKNKNFHIHKESKKYYDPVKIRE